MFFIPKAANRKGQADRVVEFVNENSELAQQVNKDYVIIKDREKPKFLPGTIVKLMDDEGYPITMGFHTYLWQSMDAKNPNKNYGVEVQGKWYWYENWVDVVRDERKKLISPTA